jgi:phosphohistidine phosphatase
MIRLCLVRHGIAGGRDAVRHPDDGRRPLTREGMRQLRRSAPGLGALAGEIDCLLTSPLLRAVQTATILHELAGMPKPRQEPALSPGSSSDQVLAALATYDAESIVIVGHEPGLRQLLAACLTGKDDGLQVRIRKGAAACLSFDTAIRAGRGQFEWLLQPKTLRSLDG